MITKQIATESVDNYLLRFQRLLRRVNSDPNTPVIATGLQVQMYLFGLSSALTSLMSTANSADLNTAIERARLVEAEYNYTPSKDTTMRGNKHKTEVNDLYKKIEQLSLNYATLASALAIQPVQNNSRRSTNYNNNPNNYRSDRQIMSQSSRSLR